MDDAPAEQLPLAAQLLRGLSCLACSGCPVADRLPTRWRTAVRQVTVTPPPTRCELRRWSVALDQDLAARGVAKSLSFPDGTAFLNSLEWSSVRNRLRDRDLRRRYGETVPELLDDPSLLRAVLLQRAAFRLSDTGWNEAENHLPRLPAAISGSAAALQDIGVHDISAQRRAMFDLDCAMFWLLAAPMVRKGSAEDAVYDFILARRARGGGPGRLDTLRIPFELDGAVDGVAENFDLEELDSLAGIFGPLENTDEPPFYLPSAS